MFGRVKSVVARGVVGRGIFFTDEVNGAFGSQITTNKDTYCTSNIKRSGQLCLILYGGNGERSSRLGLGRASYSVAQIQPHQGYSVVRSL